MDEKNARRIEEMLGPNDTVLDIGAWHIPCWRADHVVDLLPYETRGHGGCIKGNQTRERFSKDTWTIWDICSNRPLPFRDKEFDFVICSHTLEDIRDPIQACHEIVRVGKRGYVEVPSRLWESTIGVQSNRYTGFYHHRWLIDVVGEGAETEMVFRFKPHCIHESFRYHLPRRMVRGKPWADLSSWFFWEGEFKFREVANVSHVRVRAELEQFVRGHGAYPEWRYWVDDAYKQLHWRRVAGRIRRRLMRARSAPRESHEQFWARVEGIDLR
jgi:hypothetical protein